MKKLHVSTVIVTFNRRRLLEMCLTAVATQSHQPDEILIVDNASTDGTKDWLKVWLPGNLPHARVIELPQNMGGAGGFSIGLHQAIGAGSDWVWMMDDDAVPEPNALAALVGATKCGSVILGGIATTDGNTLCWPIVTTDGQSFDSADQIPEGAMVAALPFLGIFIHRKVVETIGYPDAGYFIAGDDTEYCFRAGSAGIPIYVVRGSRLRHPPSNFYRFGFGAWAPVCFRIEPWKRYYDVRNRILTSRKQGLINVWTRTVPATGLRMLAALVNEPNRWPQFKAFLVGSFDGLRGLKGRRPLSRRVSK